MKRYNYKLTDEEAELVENLRATKRWEKEQQHPLQWRNRPWCQSKHCGNKAAPVVGAKLCTWCQKRLSDVEVRGSVSW